MSKLFEVIERKGVYLSLCVLCCVFLLAPLIGKISPVQFSDGIPMLGRVYSFECGDISVGEYLFSAHGNSMHAIVYLVAILDDLLFDGKQGLLIAFLYIGMVGTGILVSAVFYERKSAVINCFLALVIALTVLIGTYNSDLYLPFQMVLTFSRFVFLLILLFFSNNLILSKNYNKHWLGLLILSCVVVPFHGMGAMFALAIFYIHIATRQKWYKSFASLLPFLFYIVLQLHFNSGFGEVTTAENFIPSHFGAFAKCVLGFYGGLFLQLFGFPQRVSAFFGSFVWLTTALILLIFFVRGFRQTNMFRRFDFLKKDLSATDVFFLGGVGVSFLASIASASFVVARMELGVPMFVQNPLGVTLTTGRYLCFSVMPYIALLYYAERVSRRLQHNGQRVIGVALAILMLYVISLDLNVTNSGTLENNKSLDLNGAALISGLDLNTEECGRVYGDFSSDWYWKDRVLTVYDNLEATEKYLWSGHPAVGSKVAYWSPEDYLNIKRVDYYDSGDRDYYCVQLVTETPPDAQYAAIVDKNNTIIGYVCVVESPRLYRLEDSGRYYYDENYYLKGYALKEMLRCDSEIYAMDCRSFDAILPPKLVARDTISVSNLNDENWDRGIFRPNNCLIFENTPENLKKIEGTIKVGDGGRIIRDVWNIEIEEQWIKIFLLEESDGVMKFAWPNNIILYKELQ